MIAYIVTSGLLLSVFYAFFMLLMRKTTFFTFNRFTLMAGSLLCLALPLIHWDFSGTAVSNVIPTLTLPEAVVSAEGGTLDAADKGISWLGAISGIYLLGALVVLIMNILSIIQTSRMIASGEHIRKDGFKITIVDAPVASFSFLGHIVISREDFTANPVILTHEMSHVRKCHSVDVLLFSAVTVLHWFNPLVWLARAELKMLHEYEADESVINQGVNAADYQLLLVRKAVGEHRFRLANGFNHTKLSNRIAMMMSEKTNGWIRLAYVACVPLLACMLCFCTSNKQTSETTEQTEDALDAEQQDINEVVAVGFKSDSTTAEEDEPVPLQLAEVKPMFQGGDANNFSKWINEHLIYPQDAKDAGKQGRVVLQFTVNKVGRMENIRVLRGCYQSLDEEALRVVKASPEWKPGMMDGKAVSVTYTFTIVFKLR